MSLNVDEQWVRDFCARTGQKLPKELQKKPKNDGLDAMPDGWQAFHEGLAAAGAHTEAGRRKKYGNLTAEADGKKFDSRHEAKIYERLRLECLATAQRSNYQFDRLRSQSDLQSNPDCNLQQHLGLGCQVTFYLPGGVKYIADFVTLEADGTYTVYDAKSEATRRDKTYRLKKRQMKNCLGIEIREV